MVDEVPTDQRAADVEERQVYVGPALVPDAQPPEAVEPGDRPLYYPAAAPRAPAARGCRQPCRRAASRALMRATPPSLHWRDGIYGREHHAGVADISCREHHCERDAFGVNDKMVLRDRFAAIRRIRHGFTAPFRMGMLDCIKIIPSPNPFGRRERGFEQATAA
jgi:hypothetical protein